MNKKKLIAQFCILLIVMLPICFADEFEQEGESLIIEAKKYEPEVLRSDYMEQLNIPVRVILGAIRGAPISVPEIKTVNVQLIKQKEAQKENATVQGTSDQTFKDYVQGSPHFYKAPYPTLDNLGYVQITLKKIPQEHKIPKTIDLDFKITITYEADITSFTIGGENVKTLKQATVETIKAYPEEYSILGGGYYLRVISVKNQEATVEILDSEFKTITTRTLRLEGTSTLSSTSTSITLPNKETEPKSIRLKLEDTRGAGAIRLSFKEGKERSFEKGQAIYGDWKVYNFYLGSSKKENYDYISLRHKEFKPQIILTTEDKYNTIAKLKEEVQKCVIPQCEIYKDSEISGIKAYKAEKEGFEAALDSLDSMGLEGLKKIDPQGAEFIVKIEEGGVTQDYRRGASIGSKSCSCKISGVTRDKIWIDGVGTGTCASSGERVNTRELKPEESATICGTFIELKEITTDQEAVVTILPGTGRGTTTTYFSVHIPVEKRALQYTPEELQNKINKTQELITKLDNTITKLQKLVEGWTKVCLATAAVFTVMSFFQGMSGKAAEKKEEGAKTEEQGKEAIKEIKIQPPEGVKFSELKYGYSPGGVGGTKLSLIDDGTYYFRDGRMYLNNQDKPIAAVGAKFEYAPKDKTKKWYVLTSEGKFKETTDQYYGEWKPGDSSGKNEVRFSQSGDIAVGLQSCSQLPSDYKYRCDNARNTYGSALVLVYFKNVDSLEVWWAGEDGKYYGNENGKLDGDQKVFEIEDSKSTGFKDVKRRLLEMQDNNKRGETKYTFGGYTYDMGKLFNSGSGATDVDCRMVMSESQCKILFNACDPVMCPASRCNFKGRYRVPNDNVIQSGLIGSLILCLPNIKEGVIMPVCLSGILAALKNIRSILQGYVNCLQAALQDDKSVGVCDRIRSVFICQIVWREAMTLLGLARGNLFDFVTGKGGGEYLTGVKGGVDNAKKTLDYFTGDYAKSVFAAYRGRSSEELGAMVCEKAIYGKVPLVGDILEDVTKAQNPVQFTAYIEEQPLYTQTGQESAYKLYYHIYAGAQKADYKVYIKKGTKTYVCSECSGTLEPEGFVDKSTLFTQEQGYKEICVAINGKHECNLGRVVSTSFGINQVNNYIMQQELSKNIKTEEDCRADIRGYIPNAQIEKTCSIINPATGKGGKEEDLWKKVGTCGKNKEGAALGDCWMKLGELAQQNPEVYQSVVGGLCEDDGGKVCQQSQTCSGRQTTTAVKEKYKNVVCCYGTCETDPKYEALKAKVKEFATKNTAYDEMYTKGVERCEDKEIATSDPFYPTDQLPTSWIEKTKDIKKEEKNEISYFKGLMFLLCSNCGDAAKEFSNIPKDGEYFKEACGENKAEEGKGGLVFERCKKTCEGKTTATAKPAAETTKPEEIKPLQLTKMVIITPSGQERDSSITENQKEIELETGGIYKIKKFIFNKPVSSCYFYYIPDSTGQFEKGNANIGKSDDATICNFEDTPIYSLGVADKSIIEIGAADKETQTDYTYSFNIKILEKAAQEGQVLLCTDPTGNQAFCLHSATYNGKRCSDFSYNKIDYKNVLDRSSSTSCNNECTTYKECITKSSPYYLTSQIVTDNGLAVK